MTNADTVAKWYNGNAALEHDRLVNNRLEFAVSWRVICQSIEKIQKLYDRPLRILDLGGGTGRYSIKLALLGHQVLLVDISQAELDIAISSANDNGVQLWGVQQADARNIKSNTSIFEAGRYDMILCQGPLYHLLEKSEQIDLLSTLSVILRDGGILIAAFVTKFAHLRGLSQKDPERLAREYDSFYKNYLISGAYTRNPSTQSFHCDLDTIKRLFKEVQSNDGSLVLTRLVGCEGFLGSHLAINLNSLTDQGYETWLNVIMQFAEQENLLGCADHILAVLIKK
ncbi:S-adenosyl-L-methionine-dependent methyltransferase [Xylogone sp. PMI_703]|nr:S-adenosyl-L-methionine-dependent methyltransferase [Xylogone sp. PMI_703]